MTPVVDSIENIVGKGENTGYHHFSFAHNILNWPLSKGCYQSGLCGKG